jgi:hypothetical protein
MNGKKEQVTEIVGIVSAVVGLVKLIASLFGKKADKPCDCKEHQSQKDD